MSSMYHVILYVYPRDLNVDICNKRRKRSCRRLRVSLFESCNRFQSSDRVFEQYNFDIVRQVVLLLESIRARSRLVTNSKKTWLQI